MRAYGFTNTGECSEWSHLKAMKTVLRTGDDPHEIWALAWRQPLAEFSILATNWCDYCDQESVEVCVSVCICFSAWKCYIVSPGACFESFVRDMRVYHRGRIWKRVRLFVLAARFDEGSRLRAFPPEVALLIGVARVRDFCAHALW